MEVAARRGLDLPDETAGQNHFPGLDALTIGGQAVDQPEDAGDRVVQHARAEAGFLDHAIARNDDADPAQVEGVDGVVRRAKHDPGVGGVVGNRIDDAARLARGGIGAQYTGILDFQAGGDIVCGGDHIGAGDLCAAQGGVHDEGDFRLNPGLDEATRWHGGAIGTVHIIQQHTGIGGGDAQRALHRTGREAYFPAGYLSPRRQLFRHQRGLNGIGVV